MSKIKILYTIPNFDTAGSGKVLYDLVKGLDKTKFEVEIACSSNRGGFFKEIQSLGVPIHIVKTTTPYRPYSSLPIRIISIRKFLKTNNYDIVHSWHWSSDWTEALAARLSGAKWLYTKKSMSWGNKHWKIRSYLANYIITINNEMTTYFPKRKNQKLIPIGIDIEYYKPSNKIASNKNNTFRIITVANLVPVKGIEVLLQAVKMMKDPSVKLMVVGDNRNEYGQSLLNLCNSLEINSQVDFIGKVEDVRPFIENTDLYIIPTIGKGEGMPMALVEAMCMAVPVLGSDISGINFVLNEFQNLLFEAGNEKVLAEKILEIKLLSESERIKLGNELREYVIQNFDYMKFIKEHQELYYKLKN